VELVKAARRSLARAVVPPENLRFWLAAECQAPLLLLEHVRREGPSCVRAPQCPRLSPYFYRLFN
jgi:hypothetical protein